MSQLLHLLKHDFRLLSRNKIITVSVIVSIAYVATFKGLSTFGDMEKILVLVIFNDPALLGFLFIGVMLLFEKNENTFQAVSVTPIKESNYVLSKSLALSTVAVACCFFMAIATKGTQFNYLLFFLAAFLSSMVFSFIGFAVVASEKSFNQYLLKAIGWLMILSLPFLGYFEVMDDYWFVLFPTQPAIDLFQVSLSEFNFSWRLLYDFTAIVIWLVLSYYIAVNRMIKYSKL